ncbi:MAG TPA: Na+/H+ antiporter NhaA [Vicinamibacterales bacterium]|nr:Na+/H+ antiporter NhaA [Vicinamibacterales bacterium]
MSLSSRVRHMVAFVLDHSLLLVAGAVAAVVWANVARASYIRVAEPLRFLVNDVGMVFFFALAALEVFQATLPGGPLATPRRAAVPLLAAAGGMLAPALIYLGLAHGLGRPALARGWAIPCATDIAFSYLVARAIFGPRHPAVPFLLLLAIADDALGLIVLALFYPAGSIRIFEFALWLAAALVCAAVLRWRRADSFWPYVLGAGTLSWLAFERGGFHPALALVPIVPFIPHGSRGHEPMVETAHRDPLTQFEHWWKNPVQVILFFFGLVNAGVPASSVGVGTWIVLASILLGKPIGILASAIAASAVRLHRAPGLAWRDLFVVGCTAGIGFTVALFFTTAAFPRGPMLDETKMGALLSFGAAVPALAAAALLRVGRFDRR